VDGRLREYVTTVPDKRWLDLFNVHYLITDKVSDAWREGVFFDRQHAVTLQPGDSVAVGYLPDYEATGLWLLAEGQTGQVTVTTTGGSTWELVPQPLGAGLWQVEWPRPAVAGRLVLRAAADSAPWEVMGLSLVDGRDGSFHTVAAGDFQLIHSGDVKIYRNLDPLPRAFVVHEWTWQPDVPAAVAYMAEHAPFDPRQTAVLVGPGESSRHFAETASTAVFTRYAADEVVLLVSGEAPGLLILTDAYYPGWQATVNGRATAIYQANGHFRTVPVPPGQHEVIFTFVSRPYQTGRLVTVLAVALWLLIFVTTVVAPYRRR
jgi:hypothetical protein